MNENVEQIFHIARVMPVAERSGYLKGVCGNDIVLRNKVEALLTADADAGSFLKTINRDDPDATMTMRHALGDPTIPAEQAGQMIGRYKLLQQIGEGGFGTVWMAEQKEPVRRRIALKIIKLGMDTKLIIARFEAERQALAMMDHPNIAKVFDAGSTESGRPYFVMELVRGIPILEYCDTEKLDTKSRLKLFMLVCNAIQHAHQKGIIHRDIKPSNVLVTLHDGVPVPKVIDFGIAKATNQELTQKTLYTEFNQMVGTPAYMSPEQAEMSGLDIDTRSDIYSLGVLLYELLTGTTPFDHKELMGRGYGEMMRIIREETPHKPSTRLSTLGETASRTAEQRHTDLKKLGMVLRGDLDWIVMRCLEKNRTRRYETATGLAADINRHLNDEPVEAGPPSAGYKMRKFVRRHKGMVVATSAVAATLLLGITGTTIGLRIAQYNAKAAINNAEIAKTARDDLSTVNTTLLEQTDSAQWSSYTANLALAQMAMDNGNYPEARDRIAACPESKRGWEWEFLSKRASIYIADISGELLLNPNGKTMLAWEFYNKRMKFMDTDGNQVGATMRTEGIPVSVKFSPDGHYLRTVSLGGYESNDQIPQKILQIWNLEGQSAGEPILYNAWTNDARFSHDNQRVLINLKDRTIRQWDFSGTVIRELHDANWVRDPLLSPDGSRLLVVDQDQTVRILNLDGS